MVTNSATIKLIIERSQPGSKIHPDVGRLVSRWKYQRHGIHEDYGGMNNAYVYFNNEMFSFHYDNVTDVARAFILAGGVPNWYIKVLKDLLIWLRASKNNYPDRYSR